MSGIFKNFKEGDVIRIMGEPTRVTYHPFVGKGRGLFGCAQVHGIECPWCRLIAEEKAKKERGA